MRSLAGFQRLSLRYQVALGVAVGFLFLFGVFSYLANQTIQRSTRVAGEERLKLAQTTASAIDALVAHAASQLERAVYRASAVGPLEAVAEELESLYHVMGTYTNLFLLAPQGQVLWSYPGPPELEGIELVRQPFIQEVLTMRRMTVGQVELPATAAHPPVAVVVIPLEWPESPMASPLLAVGILHLSHMELELIPLPWGAAKFVTQVIDERGVVLASSAQKADRVLIDPHIQLLEDLVRTRRSGVVIHDDPRGGHLVAYASLGRLRGGVVLEEREDRALAVPQDLRRTLFIFGFLGLLVVSLGAWGHARYVTRPLVELQRATQRIASGELDGPIILERGDEVGMLARGFEAMRRQLQAAGEARARFERELEERVQERTREVHRLLEKIISAQEEERQRLARELHDETAQALASLLVGIQALQASVPPEQSRARELLGRALVHGEAALKDLRRIIRDLRPSALDDLGLATAVESYARDRLSPLGMKVTWEQRGSLARLPPPVETALFRILQEAVNNIAKHSRATSVSIGLEFGQDRFTARVQDDGVGFDPQKVDPTFGVGLQGMRERAELIGARLEVSSQPGRGTVVGLELPLKEMADG